MTPELRLAREFNSPDYVFVLQVMNDDLTSMRREEVIRDPVEAMNRAFNITRQELRPVQVQRLRTVPVMEAMKVVWPENWWKTKDKSN